MKKTVTTFVKNGRKFNIRKKTVEVQEFNAKDHEGSKIDKYGRCIHGERFSWAGKVMSKDDWREETKAAMSGADEFHGIYASGTCADPSLIIEFAIDNRLGLGDEENCPMFG